MTVISIFAKSFLLDFYLKAAMPGSPIFTWKYVLNIYDVILYESCYSLCFLPCWPIWDIIRILNLKKPQKLIMKQKYAGESFVTFEILSLQAIIIISRVILIFYFIIFSTLSFN